MKGLCALCGKPPLNAARGEGNEILCHDEERDCYHRWTVYGQRPGSIAIVAGKVGAELWHSER